VGTTDAIPSPDRSWNALFAAGGQVSDVVFLILLPFMLKNLGYKKTIFIGILAWAARYFLLAGSVDAAALQTTFVFAAILLHGVCYDFLFIAGQLYVDDEANERNRGAAQGFIAFILWGVGAFVGTMLAGKSQGLHTLQEPLGKIAHDWHGIWIYPAWGAVAVLVIFLIFFREPKKQTAMPVIAGRKEENLEVP
jgi:MFS family permease